MRIVLTGASGQLGAYLLPCLASSGHEVAPWCGLTTTRQMFLPIDLTDHVATRNALDAARPEVVLHAAAMSSAEAVRRDPKLGYAINVEATRTLADWCLVHGVPMIFLSTDLVFDGDHAPYAEDDPTRPLLEYGRTKAEAETIVAHVPHHLIARVSLLYGLNKCGRSNFFDKSISAIQSAQTQTFFANEFRTPLHYQVAAEILTRLVDQETRGVIHIAGKERVSRYEFMRRAVKSLGLNDALVEANHWVETEHRERRPADVSLSTGRLEHLFPGANRLTIEESLMC